VLIREILLRTILTTKPPTGESARGVLNRTERGNAGSNSSITTVQAVDPALPRSVLLLLSLNPKA
jgi:hypothetical protein